MDKVIIILALLTLSACGSISSGGCSLVAEGHDCYIVKVVSSF